MPGHKKKKKKGINLATAIIFGENGLVFLSFLL